MYAHVRTHTHTHTHTLFIDEETVIEREGLKNDESMAQFRLF